MTATLDSAVADLQRDNSELRRQLDACPAELAARNSEYGERIEHQSATIDVLGIIKSSPVRERAGGHAFPLDGGGPGWVMPRTDPW